MSGHDLQGGDETTHTLLVHWRQDHSYLFMVWIGSPLPQFIAREVLVSQVTIHI